MKVLMNVSDIYFAQDSINCDFFNKTSIVDVFLDLLCDRISPLTFPPIVVVVYDGKHFAYDGNRRLYLFKVRTDGCQSCVILLNAIV